MTQEEEGYDIQECNAPQPKLWKGERMEILRIALACYIYTGFIFMGFVSLLAIVQKKTEVFRHGFFYVFFTVIGWPYCIYHTLK